MTILGVSTLHHDAALSVVSDNGEILFASHAERYSRRKNDKYLDMNLVREAREWGPFDTVAYYEKPCLKRARWVYSSNFKKAWDHNPKKYLTQLDILRPHHNFETWHHHKSHAAAGFQTSPFTSATVLVIDAIGEWDTATIWKAWYDNEGFARYKKMWSMRFPQSIGLIYSAITQRIGLKPSDEEYITMGMAAYGKVNYSAQITNLMGSDIQQGVGKFIPVADKEDLAYSVQKFYEDELLKLAHKAAHLTDESNLVLMGGCALNCVGNSVIVNNNIFDNIWIMPSPGDAGSSLGAAALSYGKKLVWRGPYLGHKIGNNEYPVNDIIHELNINHIVGVANGRAEFGPRALGNRSLFADPRIPNIKFLVNNVKNRQHYRPFSPVVLAEHAHQHFDMNMLGESPYMQYTLHCKNAEVQDAIAHVDLTSRVQTVTKEDHPGLRLLLETWYEQTGCPMLLNTSLNVRGLPMVNNEKDVRDFEKIYGIKVYT